MKKTNLETKGLFTGFETTPGKGLSGRFIFPPFSVLRSSDRDWLRRKRQWISLGIKSEVGRKENLLMADPNLNDMDVYRNKKKNLDTKNGEKWEPGKGLSIWQNSGTSIFDPVLCELMYTWFCPTNGQIVDPFAGGSVRGVVATYMGYRYWGCELRKEQVRANYKQGIKIVSENMPEWVCGDSTIELKNSPKADFIFSCPPYGNLETYSDLKEDLSNKPYDVFIELYANIIRKSCKRLKNNRFACFVVANYRDKKTGHYYNFVGDTIKCFQDAGLHFYNDAILMTPAGSLPLRTGKQFFAGRKLGKTHQNILIFYKGDPGKIKETFNIE